MQSDRGGGGVGSEVGYEVHLEFFFVNANSYDSIRLKLYKSLWWSNDIYF